MQTISSSIFRKTLSNITIRSPRYDSYLRAKDKAETLGKKLPYTEKEFISVTDLSYGYKEVRVINANESSILSSTASLMVLREATSDFDASHSVVFCDYESLAFHAETLHSLAVFAKIGSVLYWLPLNESNKRYFESMAEDLQRKAEALLLPDNKSYNPSRQKKFPKKTFNDGIEYNTIAPDYPKEV